MFEENLNASFSFDASYHTRETICLDWGDIYKIFINEDYPKHRESIEGEESEDQNRGDEGDDYDAYATI